MSLRKKRTSKTPAIEASRSGRQIEDDPYVVRVVYNDTYRFLEKGEDVLRWGDIYQMLKKNNFAIDAEDQDELTIFKNNKRFKIHRVAACIVVFPYVDSITWILKNVYLGNIYIFATPRKNL